MTYPHGSLLSAYATVKKRGIQNPVYILTALKHPVRESGIELSDEKKMIREEIKASFEPPENTVEDETDDKENKRFANNIIRSRNNVIQLAANNPWEYFVTLTLRRDSDEFDAYDINSVKSKLLKFFYNYSQRSGSKTNFKYLLVPEMHKDGAWHFHGLMSGINEKDLFINSNGYLDFKPYSDRFGYIGFGKKRRKGQNKCEMGRIRDLNKTATYISKYISKSMFGDDADIQKGMHLYYASRGLKKDTLLVKGRLCSTPDFVKQNCGFENEFCIKIFSEKPDELVDKVTPYVNLFKIPSLENAPIAFACKYKNLAKLLGVNPLNSFDYVVKSENYDIVMNFLKYNDMLDYKPSKYSRETLEGLLGLRDATFISSAVPSSVLPAPEPKQLECSLAGFCDVLGN